MKIRVKGDDQKHGFKFWVPLWLIKCNFVSGLIEKNSGGSVDMKTIKTLLNLSYKELRKHKGLVIVDITSSDGSIVKITV